MATLVLSVIIPIFTILFCWITCKVDPLDHIRVNNVPVIRNAIGFGLVTGMVLFLLYGIMQNHNWEIIECVWCVSCMFSASILVDVLKNQKRLRW